MGRLACFPPVLCYKPITRHLFREFDVNSPFPLAEHAPLPGYEDQAAFFAPAFEVLQQAIGQRAFPGASIAVIHKGKLVALKAFGRFTFDQKSSAVATASVFDLASVSKVLATTSMAMLLYQRGLLDLETPVAAIVPEFGGTDPRRKEVTLRMLLAHSSGLPAYEKLFLRKHTRAELLAATFSTGLTADPDTRTEYSDIGFIVLATALERIADESLDRFCQREVFSPLGMLQTAFNPPVAWREGIPPTADDKTFRHRIIQGEVQDENASVLGGVAGHAGVFSSVVDLSVFANVMLQGGRPLFRSETVAVFTRRETSPMGTSRALGWDTPSAPSQSGKYFSVRAFGHLGYTGTSLWIDPERQLSVIMLTNRTWPDCKEHSIKQVRPAFHDAVIESLETSR